MVGSIFALSGNVAQILTSEITVILALIFGGCCSNVFSLEILINDAPKSGHLVTFGQFAFVALEGLRHHVEWGRFGPRLKPTVVPLSRWFVLVLLFFTVSVLNNLALGYRISVPLHIVFRCGNLIINMIMGILLLGKRYNAGQVTGVLLVTLGVIMTTLSDASTGNSTNDEASTSEFLIGITILVVAMVLSAGMGLFQEVTYKKYGKQWREGLFYTHFLALPFFLLFYKDLVAQTAVYNASPLLPLSTIIEHTPVIGRFSASSLSPQIHTALENIKIPKLWASLVLNMLTQYVCIAGVNRMTAVATSLTLNLVLNLRKFISLLISIIYFENEFGTAAMVGTGLVVLGLAVYTRGTQQPAKQKTT
ncbi:golgi uridine diphosphate-N- acetylglucosamine transporter [Apophysomyces ossiformis]|uniref:Golgi uridine diphosphate-N- acetylglucosamine transporter n=1 Tax=Apophysomyces ossiformis TaxID=679940 RepID=A0A8H7BL84_9FUNG|nr:golgi uridine diphosphate-N- acetylglucosamine transporter [Apophysomyces ossiformis]